MPITWFKGLNAVFGLPSLVAVDGIKHTPEALTLWRAMMVEDDQALEELASIGIRFRDRGEGLELCPLNPMHRWTDEEIDEKHIEMSRMPRISMMAEDAGLKFVNCDKMPDRKKVGRYMKMMRLLRLAD